MSVVEIFILAFALAADAFSVGAAVGLTHRKPRQIFRLSWHFGLFQALMPLIGAILGNLILDYIKAVDHWVAFILLSAIGIKMIYESTQSDTKPATADLTKGLFLILLSTGVSIDAFAAGISLSVLKAPLALSLTIIGIVAGLSTLCAMVIAHRINALIGKKSELTAGIVLILLGVRIQLTG